MSYKEIVLEKAIRDIYEVWAGSEGFKPETASEAYQARLLDQIAGIASSALDEIGVVHD